MVNAVANMAEFLGITVEVTDLVPKGALFEVAEGSWVLLYSESTPYSRLLHLLGHYFMHRDSHKHFVGSTDTEMDAEADAFSALLQACSTAS